MQSSSQSLSDLAAAAREGDRAARDRLFALGADRVQLFIRARLGRRLRATDDSLDVLQATYLSAHGAFGQFEWCGEREFVHWLCGFADRRIRRLAEHHGARKRRPPSGRHRVSEVLDRVVASGDGVATLVGRREQRERLATALDALDDGDREILLRRHFEGQTIDAIATATGRSASAVRRALGRGLRNLGGALREGGATDDRQ